MCPGWASAAGVQNHFSAAEARATVCCEPHEARCPPGVGQNPTHLSPPPPCRKALTRYQMLFRHMFYCKHVERQLCSVWISNKAAKQCSLHSAKWCVTPARAPRARVPSLFAERQFAARLCSF